MYPEKTERITISNGGSSIQLYKWFWC